jgi:hypothetical protein
MNVIDGILNSLKELSKRVSRLEVNPQPRWVFLQAPLTSGDWDWDAYANAGPLLIDLSAVFGVPAKVRAVVLQARAYDTVAGPTGVPYFTVGPTNTAYESVTTEPIGSGIIYSNNGVCPCNADGDIYYRTISAGGAATLHCSIEIFGYYI